MENTTSPNEYTQNNVTPSAVDEAPPANMTQNNANMAGGSMENNATSTAVPENATSLSGSTASNNAGNTQESNSKLTTAAPNTGTSYGRRAPIPSTTIRRYR
ncbi:MAG: hypothetical protein WA364_00065 [Candidatus Nitrosopolaris sp.]